MMQELLAHVLVCLVSTQQAVTCELSSVSLVCQTTWAPGSRKLQPECAHPPVLNRPHVTSLRQDAAECSVFDRRQIESIQDVPLLMKSGAGRGWSAAGPQEIVYRTKHRG